MISIETSGIEFNASMGTVTLKFTGEIELEYAYVQSVDPNDEENMLIIARELLTQVKIMTALTRDN